MNASRSPSARIATYDAVHGPTPGSSSSGAGIRAVGEVEVGRGQRADRLGARTRGPGISASRSAAGVGQTRVSEPDGAASGSP